MLESEGMLGFIANPFNGIESVTIDSSLWKDKDDTRIHSMELKATTSHTVIAGFT